MKSEKNTRRDFIKKSLAATAGAAVYPTILPAASKWKGANDRINVFHIGVGARGFGTVKYAFFNSDDIRSVAVCDPFKSRRDNAAAAIDQHYKEKLNTSVNCKAYIDYREGLERSDIDAVHIASGDYWHIPMSYHSAAAGKHIYMEKPLGLSLDNILKLEKMVKEKGVKFHYGTQQRSMPHMKKGIEMVRSGKIGDVEKLDIWCPGARPEPPKNTMITPPPTDLHYDRWLGPSPYRPYSEARVDKFGIWFIYDYALGFIAGWGAHPLDIAVWGAKEQMSDTGNFKGKGSFFEKSSIFNTISEWDMDIEYNNGLKARFFSNDVGKEYISKYLPEFKGDGTTFFGTKGWISLGRGHGHSDIPGIQKELDKYWEKRGESNHAQSFADVIKGRTPELCPLEDAIISDCISHMGNISIRTGNELEWDIKKRQIINHPEYIKEHFHRVARKGYEI